MLRKLVKTGIASGLYWTGADRLFGSREPLIISYHRVVEDFHKSALLSIDPMLVTKKTLERHLDWIGKRYDFISLDELANWMEGGMEFRRPVAAITFDDGYSDVYEHGLPILKRKGVPSAIFVVTDRVGTTDLQIHDELYLWISHALSKWKHPAREIGEVLKGLQIQPFKADMLIKNIDDPYLFTRLSLEYFCQNDLRKVIAGLAASVESDDDMFRDFYSVTWDMLREMSRNDVTIGSHTKTHPLLVNESPQKVLDEAVGSRFAVEQQLGMPVHHFAYPDGQFNSNVVQAVKQAGYRYAYTTCAHRDTENPLLTIPRKVMWENTNQDAFNRFSSAILSCQVNGVFDRMKGCAHNHA